MVIRLDSNRVKNVINHNVDPIGLEGDSDSALGTAPGMSEADKIVEGARKTIASSGLADDPETAEKTNSQTLEKMASHGKQDPGPEISIPENKELPSVDILSPHRSNYNPSGSTK